VTIEMSPYDLEKGRLIFRHKDERPEWWSPPRKHQPRGQFPAPMRTARRPSSIARDNPGLVCADGPVGWDQKIVHVRIVLNTYLT